MFTLKLIFQGKLCV